jgi:hypothetical protein
MNVPAVPAALDKALEYTDKVIALKPDETAGYINKRIALMKYIDYWQQQKASADRDVMGAGRDKEKRKELMAKADALTPNIDKYKKMLDETSKGLAEAAKKPQPTPPGAPAK